MFYYKEPKCKLCNDEGVILATTKDGLKTAAFRCPDKCTDRVPEIVKEWRDEYRNIYVPEWEGRGVRVWKNL